MNADEYNLNTGENVIYKNYQYNQMRMVYFHLH
jgi:hypothetical protein